MHRDAGGIPLESRARVTVDGAGIAGAALEFQAPENDGRRRCMDLSTLASEIIQPVIVAAARILGAGEFLGQARCQIDLIGISRAWLLQAGEGEGVGRVWVPSTGDLVLPADDGQIQTLAVLSANAYGRSAGVAAWD